MLGPRKAIAALHDHAEEKRLRQTLSWPHLVAMGVGAIVGTGIYTLIGQGAGLAGPAVILSFALAGAVCACAALCYAELAAAMPAAGSAYTYSYVAMGEWIAWIVGWSLVLEYSAVSAAVATGWAGHAAGLLEQAGLGLPEMWLHGPREGGVFNVLGAFVSLLVTGMLLLGTRESATVNLVLVVIKMLALAVFIAITVTVFNAANFEPFMPNGFGGNPFDNATGPDGKRVGVAAAAAIIFFAFYGFDAVSTAAEETKNPGRDLKIGIIGSMVVCTLLYMVIAACAIGAMRAEEFAAADAPLAYILETLGHPFAANLIYWAAVLALPTVILVFMYGQIRIFFVMSRDGLLPSGLSRVNQKTGVPTAVTLVVGIIIAIISGLFELGDIAAVANAGTLAAFIAVAASVMVARRTHGDLARPFRTPAVWLVAPLAIIGCLYLFSSLNPLTIKIFFAWNLAGVVFCVLWKQLRRKSA